MPFSGKGRTRINIYGLGYVGVFSACLANHGFDVTGVDIDKLKVDMINKEEIRCRARIAEAIRKPSLKKLRATVNGVGPADISIICVGTPSNDNGSLQLSISSA
jgi:GDP-mannose 6-dehydrogenase